VEGCSCCQLRGLGLVDSGWGRLNMSWYAFRWWRDVGSLEEAVGVDLSKWEVVKRWGITNRQGFRVILRS